MRFGVALLSAVLITGASLILSPVAFGATIWPATAVPVTVDAGPDSSVELGVKFRSDVAGTVSGIRFYKASGNTGSHTGTLWSGTGTRLARATFSNETASGWQQVNFSPPVAISANTVYVASYHASRGHYSADQNYFATTGIDSPPLHALANGVSGVNGVHVYNNSSRFPTLGRNSSNYWVDVVFSAAPPPDTTAPTVTAFTIPATATTLTVPISNFTASDNTAVTGYLVTESATRPAAGASGWSATAPTSYTVAAAGTRTLYAWARDAAGNVSDSRSATVTITVAAPTGGPILIISSASNPFSSYYAEILRAEGFTECALRDISAVTVTELAAYDVAILGEMPLSDSQITTLSNWVNAGGHLIAMRPDKKLAGLLGLIDQAATMSDAYLRVDTNTGPGVGIVSDTIQFHGVADLYTLNGATLLAELYGDAVTGSSRPAVSVQSVGANGGQAAAFAYDLARSVVLTRQGNPAWSGQERDGFAPIRSDDLFYGAASFDPRPDWIDRGKVAIPQADEQQRLLANMLILMNRDKKPLPRFWYFPRALPAVVVMTGDDHSGGGTAGRFDSYLANSPANCSVNNWECVRGTSYIYTSTPLSNTQAAAYNSAGFEIALHVLTNCADWTPASLESFYTSQLAAWRAKYVSLPAPATNRTHCIVWSDYVTQPAVEWAHGIRLDTNYYYWPPNWVNDTPGFFTGSGMPMRFADSGGNLMDVYQATTQMTDESGQSYPFTIDRFLDRASGSEGYYGAFVVNAHTDVAASSVSDAIVGSARARGIPVISARQLLTWLDGRNGSTFTNLAWDGNTLVFAVSAAPGATGLMAMVPAPDEQAVTGVTRNGTSVPFTMVTVKGIPYARFAATNGSYQVTYDTGTPPPPPPPPSSGPFSLWPDSTIPGIIDSGPDNAVELGIKFRSDVSGTISGIRFYKSVANSGTHTGSLWTATGTRLATATFSNETASGWQQVNFATPVTISANTVYVASYHSGSGHYSVDQNFFATTGVDAPPLHAPANGVSGFNGTYAYGAATSFPNQGWNSANYWVDVVFNTTTSSDTTPPAVTAFTIPATATTLTVPITAFTATDNLAVTGYLVTESATRPDAAAGGWTTAAPGSYTVATAGTRTLYAWARDAAGNVSDSMIATVVITIPSSGLEPAGWFAGDMHVHRSCGGAPESISSMYQKMAPNNLAAISLLADMGNGEVQDPFLDLPRVNGENDPVSTPGRIVHWDAEWHWDPIYYQYAHQALGGHVVALGLLEAHPIWEEYTYPIFSWAHQQNGIAGFAHMQYLPDGIPQSLNCCIPLEYPVEVALGAADFVSLDVVNNSFIPSNMKADNAISAYYRLLNCGFRPGLAAGTDHPCNDGTTVGSPLTYVRVAGGDMTYRNWIEGLAAGRTVVSLNGHNEFLDLKVNGTAAPGDEIHLTGGGTVEVTVTWTANQNLSGTIELVSNGVVVASRQASAAAGSPASLSATVSFSRSGWLAARRMGSSGQQLHTAAVFVTVDNAPVRASAGDAQYFIDWIDNLLTKTSPGGVWSSYFVDSRSAAQARYQSAKALYQQIALEAGAVVPPPQQEETIFTSQTPGLFENDADYELGTRFWSDVNGQINQVRLYTNALEGGVHTVRIWRVSDRTVLAGPYSWTITSGTTGWKTFTLHAPLAITANIDYIVAISNSSDRYYASGIGGFAAPIVNGHLHTYTGSGVYSTVLGAMPTSVWNNSNYFRDVQFVPQQ